MKFHEKIVDVVNVAQSIDCNQQARTGIERICNIERNEQLEKWNELGTWLINNRNATVEEIIFVRARLNNGEKIQNYQVGNIWGVK